MPRAKHSTEVLAVLATLIGCHGGTFRVEGPLASSAPLPVTGELGFSAAACNPGTPASGLAADRESSATVGTMKVVVSPPHRELSTMKLFGEQALADFEALFAKLDDANLSGRMAVTRAELVKGTEIEATLNDADELLRAMRAILVLPSSTTERTEFTFAGKDGDRTALGTCWTSTTTRTFGAFDDPRFSFSCRIRTGGITRELKVRGTGSWANYAFRGELAAPGEEAYAFVSQNVSVMGAGGVRGFELSGSKGQVAALSFWQTANKDNPNESDPAAWILPDAAPDLRDAFATVLALSYVYPWPSGCDARQLHDKGVDAGK